MSFTDDIVALGAKASKVTGERYEHPWGSQGCPSGRKMRSEWPRVACAVKITAVLLSLYPMVTVVGVEVQMSCGRFMRTILCADT